MTTFLLGADPEIFVRKNGKAVSAFGLCEGTKKSPLKTSHGAIQVDGTALEFNINPSPSNDFELFNLNIVRTIAALRDAAPGYNLNISPVQDYDEAVLAAMPDEAKELGCDPDFNAYTLAPNPRPDGEKSFRTGAGHIHIGWASDIPVDNAEHVGICAGFIKMLDATVGMYMTCIDREPRRRELYGKAGAFRPKPYGVEYRTPSNVWIKNRNRRRLMHSFINTALRFHTRGSFPMSVTGLSEDDIVRVINDGDFMLAEKVVRSFCGYELGPVFDSVMKEVYREQEKPKAATAINEELL